MSTIKLNEQELVQVISETVNKLLSEMAVRPQTLEKVQMAINDFNQKYTQLDSEFGGISLSDKDGEYILRKSPKLDKRGVMTFVLYDVFMRKSEMFKCIFDKSKLDPFSGKYEDGFKMLKWLNRMLQRTETDLRSENIE